MVRKKGGKTSSARPEQAANRNIRQRTFCRTATTSVLRVAMNLSPPFPQTIHVQFTLVHTRTSTDTRAHTAADSNLPTVRLGRPSLWLR